MIFSTKMYDRLKFLALVGLPAFAVLYSGFGELWNLPFTDQIVGTIILLDTFLGALLQISSKNFNASAAHFDGFLSSSGTHPDTGLPNLKMTITKSPDEILANKVVRLKVGDVPTVS